MTGRTDAMRQVSHMEERIQAAESLLRACHFCEHRCGLDRTQSGAGKCGCTSDSRIYFEDLLWGEEESITPTYAVFFAGCNLRCEFCCAAESNRRPTSHPPADPREVAARVRRHRPAPISFSFIGGEPTVHLHTALRIAGALPSGLQLIWNSNFYFTSEAAALLDGVIDVFIADLHFGNDECARLLAGAENYLGVVTRNLRWAHDRKPLVLRHLVVPGHGECCTEPVLRWVAAELPAADVRLMTNYLPGKSRLIPEMNRPLAAAEIGRAEELARALGIGESGWDTNRK